MNEKAQLKTFLLTLFVFVVMVLSQLATASVSVRPIVSGYSAGSYSAPAGTFTTAANAASYGASGVTQVAGKAVTVPATLRMAANAGQIAKNAMRLNPAGLIGTLAAGWLLNEGLEYLNDQWNITDTAVGAGFALCQGSTGHTGDPGFVRPYIEALGANRTDSPMWFDGSTSGRFDYKITTGAYAGYVLGYMNCLNPVPATRPATDDDWDALPDPLPVVAPELPYAPYIEGAPVDAPEYEFAPFSTPIGDPYAKPDGSTAQPMASVSPNGDAVTIDTYDLPLTDSAGQPVAAPVPEDTPEPEPDPCAENPGRIGCMQAGTSDGYLLPVESVSLSFAPEAAVISGSCPAPISVLGQSMSFQPACDAMGMIKPLVLALAGVMVGFMVINTLRVR